MIHSRSYTSATPGSNLPLAGSAKVDSAKAGGRLAILGTSNNAAFRWRTAWSAIFLLGVLLRCLRLSWQPLWWDEGYSVFFATEPLRTMLSLTAEDIHPPLYYTLLHFWFELFGSSAPETARLFSVLVGIATLPAITWASLSLLPERRWLALLVTLFLSISPIHIYYSQEVRMYGFALLLGIFSSTLLWRMQQKLEQGNSPYAEAPGYVIASSLALLTLYYAGLLLLAHQLWALLVNRKHIRRYVWHFTVAVAILLIQLPWWLYALPKLFTYAADKVLADQDVSLPLWSYLWRHWIAFTTGHLSAPQPTLDLSRLVITVAILLLLAVTLRTLWRTERQVAPFLLTLLIAPTIVGFVVNLFYPFFPEGGERLLLQLLPYLLLLLSLASTQLIASSAYWGWLLPVLVLVGSGLGITTFYTTPRYTEHDYRPIITHVTTYGSEDDSVLALFPWQVGYWRAYSPRMENGTWLPPQPAPVDQTILVWDEAFAGRIDAELKSGTLWFPMPLSFGSTLPMEIESYLEAHARNVENRWYSQATRLAAWVRQDQAPEQIQLNVSFQDQVELVSVGVAPTTITSDNSPLAIDLCWQPATPRDDLRATLRLLDANDLVWASRDLTPLAYYAGHHTDNPCLESVALTIPAGLPPGNYQLAIGVGPDMSEELFTPQASASPLVTVSQVTVTAPDDTLSPYRLPVQFRLSTPGEDTGLRLYGYSGPGPTDQLLAGDEVALTLYLQKSAAEASARDLYLSLLDRNGNGVAGWQGWPLPEYTTDIWAQGALAQVPVHFYLPPDLAAGSYRLIAGFVDPASSTKSAPVELNRVEVTRRAQSFTAPALQSQLSPPATIGTHAEVIGYDVSQAGDSIHLELVWHVLQPLLPPHHVFVHLVDAQGNRVAQSDGEPMTQDGRAPTGSWLPDEYLITRHTLTLPLDAQSPFTIQTGLYLPASGARLPVTVDAQVTGDSITIFLPTP